MRAHASEIGGEGRCSRLSRTACDPKTRTLGLTMLNEPPGRYCGFTAIVQ